MDWPRLRQVLWAEKLDRSNRSIFNTPIIAPSPEAARSPRRIGTSPVANGLGWGFDGMDGVIFALISPLVIKEFALTVPEYRTGLQIALFFGIAGLYFWPWLSDRSGGARCSPSTSRCSRC